MPKYAVKVYEMYVDEYVVEAPDRREALRMVTDYEHATATITQVVTLEFSEHDRTEITEIGDASA